MKYCNTGIINCKDCWDWDKDRCKVNLYNPNDKVAEAIATRDKWWIEKIDNYFMESRLRSTLVPEHFNYIPLDYQEWQSLKQSALKVISVGEKTNGECCDCVNYRSNSPDDACYAGIFPEYNRTMECKSFKQSLEVK